MQKTYLFYDIETTGRSKCFDQVLQFAAIRTDLELNELERHQFQIKLNCDIVPDPEAILIHRIPMAAMREGESEIDAMAKIHALLNTPGTISGGYNTLGFDDEFLRFSFHRNLLPPYTHQWANECGRFDLYPLAQLYFLYHPDCLNWPTKSDGKLSLKLEHLNAANHLATGAAHNAIVDVEATLALAHIFKQNQKMWDYSLHYFNKQVDLKRRSDLTPALNNTQQLALLVGETGSDNFFQYPVVSLGQHNHYKNQTLWLRLDKPELTTTTLDSLSATTWVARKRAGEPGFLLPFSGRFIRHLSGERQQLAHENLSWLEKNATLFQAIQHYHREYKYPEIANVDVDADLYNAGFLTSEEERLCARFHVVPPDKKAGIAEQFRNPRLQQIASRLIGRHYPEHLTPRLTELFTQYLHCRNSPDNLTAPVDYRGNKRLTATAAKESLVQIRNVGSLEEEKMELLKGLEEFIRAKL